MGFKIGVAIPIGYYHGSSGQTIKARIEDESGAVFGAELTLVENAAFVAVGITGYYESSFTPDAAGRWTALIYWDSIKYGQMFYDVGGGLTLQEKADVEQEAEDALVGEDLDHLMAVAHPTGDPVADTLLDLIMNKGAGQTFNRATDSLEFLGEVMASILADTVTIAWGDITGIINDIGVFPTANYATLAAYVEDIRARLIVILADTNEVQTSLADGGFTDLLIDSIIERTANLPDDPADASDIAAAHALLATEAKQDIIDGLIDGIVADIGVFPTVNYASLALYVEDIRTRLIAIVADTGAIAWGDITGIVNDIGVFPTANYATIAAYVEDVRTRLIAIVGDTNEVQTSLADGGFTDLLIDSIISKVDVIDGFHDVPAQNAITNAQMRDVIGNKTDAAVQDADATQKSIIALVKGLLDILWDADGIVAWSAAAAPANGVSLSEAVRYIVENQIGAAFDGTPSLYTAIITGYTGAAAATPVGALIERLQLLQEALIGANTEFTTAAATVNTVTCAALVDRAGLYEKMMLVPTSGNQNGQGRYITDYDGDDVLTVVPDWSTDPDAGGAFTFVIVPTPAGFLYEAGKGLSANYDLVNGIPVLTRIYSDYDIQAEDVEENIFEYDDIAYIMHFEWVEWHLDEMLAGDTIRVRVYVKDNDTDNNERCIFDQSYGGVQAVPVQYIQLPPTDLYFKTTVEQVDIDTALIDVLFKCYKKS